MFPMNDIPVDRKLLGTVNIAKDESNKTRISQEAEIDGKKIKITLTFNHDVKASEAEKVMKRNLDKVAQLTVAYKLGTMDDKNETTRSLILHRDAQLTRYYTKGNLRDTHEITYGPEVVKNHLTQSITNYVQQHPISANSEEPVVMPSYKESANNMPPPFRSPPKLSATQTNETGGYFEDKFVIDGKTYMEKALRANTVDMLKEGLEEKIKGLGAKIEGLESKITEMEKMPIAEMDSDEDLDFETKLNAANAELKKAREDLKKANEDLEKYSKSFDGVTHGSTNTPRFAFIKMGPEGAKKEMAPILSNLRIQTVENVSGNTVSAVTRSAAITDFRYGEVSLQELKDLNVFEGILHPKLFVVEDLNTEPEEKKLRAFYLKEGESPEKLEDVALLVKAKALIGYGPEALIDEKLYPHTATLKILLTKIQSSSSIEEGVKKLSSVEKAELGRLPIKNEKLDEVIRERTGYLKQLVLQDLQLHLETNPVTDSTKPILYGRTAIVDLQKAANNEAGCIIHERTQGLDMKAVFDTLKDATVVFEDVKAAYVDDEGVIHMPKKCAGNAIEEVKIQPVFFNICVQGSSGHTINRGMQKAINDETLKDLESYLDLIGSPESPELSDLQESLSALELDNESEKYDPNTAVLRVTKFLQANNGYSGINCYGGKDRTGYCVALITHDKIRELTGKKVTDDEMKAVGHQLLSSDGVAAKIAQDNADHTTLKLTRNDLLLFDVGSFKGKMLRTSQGADGIFMWVKSNSKKAVGLSPLMVSSTPNQIYKEEAMQELNHPKKAKKGKAIQKDESLKTTNKAHGIFDRFRISKANKRNDDELMEIELEPLNQGRQGKYQMEMDIDEDTGSQSNDMNDDMNIELPRWKKPANDKMEIEDDDDEIK